MVAREREHHHGLNCWLTIDRHNALGYTTYGQDSGLWLIDDSIESIDIVHTQVADRERTAAYIVWSEFASLRFCHQFCTLASNLAQAECIRQVNDRNNQPLLNSYC